jgi:DNA-binding MarR family transcriptional regulator
MLGTTMRPTNKIGYLLQHVSFVLARQADQALQERLGIGFSQYKILMTLQMNPHVQQKQIAESLGQTEASISRQIKLLHEKGMLTTRINPDNKRVHITTPTTKGLKMTEAARAVFQDVYGPMFDRMSPKTQQQLTEGLESMHDFACQPGKTAACDHPLDVFYVKK